MQTYTVLVGANVVGLMTSIFLALQHYSIVGSGSICELGSSMSCSVVLSSSWATLLGVPVAIHGVAYFVLALSCALFGHLYSGTDLRVDRDICMANIGCSSVGLLSVLYFLFAEYMLGAICPLCTVVHLVVVVSLVFSVRIARESAFKGFWAVDAWLDFIMRRIRLILIGVSIAMLPIVFFNLPGLNPVYSPEQRLALATCLAGRQVTMYGAEGCSHCLAQSGLFEPDAFAIVPHVDCVTNEDICNKLKIEGYPTWIRKDSDQWLVGTTALADLASWSDCVVEMNV